MMMRVMLYEAAQSMLRSKKWSWLKAWAMQIARRRGMKKAIVALARRLAVIMLGEQSRIVNRMKAALIRLGIRGFNPKLKKATARLEELRTPENVPIPPNTLAELRRDMERR